MPLVSGWMSFPVSALTRISEVIAAAMSWRGSSASITGPIFDDAMSVDMRGGFEYGDEADTRAPTIRKVSASTANCEPKRYYKRRHGIKREMDGCTHCRPLAIARR